jgi:hypothetical protein
MWDDGQLGFWEHTPELVALAELPDWLLPYLRVKGA